MNEQSFRKYWNKLSDDLFSRPDAWGQTNFLPDVAYRGLPRDYDLLTTLQRLPLGVSRKDKDMRPLDTDDDRANELAHRERRLIDSFRKYACDLLKFGTTDWDVMLLAQHYRLPTRLLDWTLSPLVALFFASERIQNGEKKEPSGVIWCVSRTRTNELLNSNLALLKDHRTQQVDLEMLKQHYPTVGDFDKEDPNALIWFEPPSVDPRIVNQFAYFSIMPGVMTRTDDWLNKHHDTWRKVTIRADMKAEIRKRLYLLNVTDRTLFPGLEGVAKWQKAYYSD